MIAELIGEIAKSTNLHLIHGPSSQSLPHELRAPETSPESLVLPAMPAAVYAAVAEDELVRRVRSRLAPPAESHHPGDMDEPDYLRRKRAQGKAEPRGQDPR